VGNEQHIARHGLPGDQHVVGADRAFLWSRQARTSPAGRVLFVELEHDKLKSIDQSQILRHPPAPERAIKQLVRDDR
jgi:hypothetical protein